MKASIGKVMSEADQNLRVGFAGSNGNNNDVELRDLNASQGADTQINLLLEGLYERTYQGNSQFYDAFEKSGKYLACRKTNVMNVAVAAIPLMVTTLIPRVAQRCQRRREPANRITFCWLPMAVWRGWLAVMSTITMA